MSALSALLFYWRVLPFVVRVFSRLFQRTLGVGGAEGVGVAANIFVGMVEAPLLVRPYIAKLTRSELFSLMTVGMATIAGTVMVLYASIVGGVIPDALGHILTASVISAPAAVMLARIMVPERDAPTPGDIDTGEPYQSAMDAIVKGTFQGVDLLIKVIALIIVLVALVALVNIVLGLLPDAGTAPLTLQRILGWMMAPVMWLVGVPWSEAATAGSLMGTKTVLNEFIAYVDLASLPPGTLDERTRLLVMYAMCGFANPGSLGIMIGGMGAMAPERRGEIVSLGIRSIVAGTMATCMTAAVAGFFF
jgi:CNT family concentrative nucleoside transporter